jgi:osmotically-inducible protein OsmY
VKREVEMPDNRTLQAVVMAELQSVPEIDAARIGVTAHDGVFTLSGIVATMAEKHAVERAVRRVRGVLAIAQEIAVHPADSDKQSDEEIAERALKILHWDVHVPHDQIRLKVEKGSVTLSGTVAHPFQKRAAVRDIRQLSGVIDIIDDIGFIPIAHATTDHAMVREKIEVALRQEAEQPASHFRSRSRTDGFFCAAKSRPGATVKSPRPPPGLLRASSRWRINSPSASDITTGHADDIAVRIWHDEGSRTPWFRPHRLIERHAHRAFSP